ncbi:hypothetical protein GGF50DRAFT_120214 [Schizophyllum commune]
MIACPPPPPRPAHHWAPPPPFTSFLPSCLEAAVHNTLAAEPRAPPLPPAMNRNHLNLNLTEELRRLPTKSQREEEPYDTVESPPPVDGGEDGPLEWDWDIEHEDRKREAAADATFLDASPFQVDRRVLKDVVREQMSVDVGRIQFLSAGTFHKAYLVTLQNRRQIIARVARRFMPRLKTESEVATMDYLRTFTNIPVPDVFYYDSNPYNRLGGEYILMSKAKGIPLSRVYHGLSYKELVGLLRNMAHLLLPLFAHRFPKLGSLYFGPDPMASTSSSTNNNNTANTPSAKPRSSAHRHYAGVPFSPTLTPRFNSPEFHVGPIISWPFFGSNRGDLAHPHELDRGPWTSTREYLAACVAREISAVVRENEGKSAPHRLHLDPDEIRSSRHHHLRAVPGDESDDSDEWDAQESEDEWEGPGDAMYRDYRRMQRSTFLIAHLNRRVEEVGREMARWMRVMEGLLGRLYGGEGPEGAGEGEGEEFGLDCHDLSLENVFVDEVDHTRITCIIDWESTTTRPLWACTHMPAFLQASPFTANLFREIVRKIALAVPPTPRSVLQPRARPLSRQSSQAGGQMLQPSISRANTFPPPPQLAMTPTDGHFRTAASINTTSADHPAERQYPRFRLPVSEADLAALAREWIAFEQAGSRLRLAHRCVEWDGWEEGLVDTILGPEDAEEEWYKDTEGEGLEGSTTAAFSPAPEPAGQEYGHFGQLGAVASEPPLPLLPRQGDTQPAPVGLGAASAAPVLQGALGRRKPSAKLPFKQEKEKEQMLDMTGDICGGRGGELGRRLEAWLTVNGNGDGQVEVGRKWRGGEEEEA